MFKQLINKLWCQLRQAVNLVGGLFRKEHGDKDFGFFFKIARFVVEPQVLGPFNNPPCALSQDERNSVRIVLHLEVRFRASKCLGTVRHKRMTVLVRKPTAFLVSNTLAAFGQSQDARHNQLPSS